MILPSLRPRVSLPLSTLPWDEAAVQVRWREAPVPLKTRHKTAPRRRAAPAKAPATRAPKPQPA